jgi:two-component system sensor histidine kinase CpxA
MRSLFAKILVWFVATTTVLLAGILLTTALNYNLPGRNKMPVTILINYQLQEARHSFETGGAMELAATLQRIQDATQTEAVLTDSGGRDLATGRPRPELVREGELRQRSPLAKLDSKLFARQSSDGKYWFFLVGGRSSGLLWYVQPETLWVWGLVVLLCYGLALHLTSPLRRLGRAVDRFGRGELDSRADALRRDEIGQLAGTFNQMADRIVSLRQSEHRLLLDLSHELRSPLTRLSVAIELARSGNPGALPLDRIQKEADRLNDLVSELLEVTRAESDPSRRKVESVSLDGLVRSLADDCAIEAKARGCSLSLVRMDAVTVDGNPELLRRAIENVVRNAIRYAPPSTAIEVSLTVAGDHARLGIRDYGQGVPPEALPHLFDPFYRVDADRNRSSGGVGLGLSIARRSIELHRGMIKARNASPGLEVEMTLPVGQPASKSPLEARPMLQEH